MISTKLLKTAPILPIGEEEIAAISNIRKRNKAKQNAERRTDNLIAVGLLADYVYGHDNGKQHPKAGPLRSCLAEDLWSPIRVQKAGEQETDISLFVMTPKREPSVMCPRNANHFWAIQYVTQGSKS